MILISHPTGNQNSRQAALAFKENAVLRQFVTAISFPSRSLLVRLLPLRIRSELLRRDFSDILPIFTVRSVAKLREAARIVFKKLGWKVLIRRETGWASVDKIYQAVDKAVAYQVKNESFLKAVYAYEDGALETFIAAREHGIERFYELPIGYWRAHRRLCNEEGSLQPEWAHTWHADMDSDVKVLRKDDELALANHIIVPSRFVADSLKDYPGSLPPISVIPYGCPQPISPEARSWYAGGPLKVLFVGGLSQRKGLSYLLNAIEPLGAAVELTVIGSGTGRKMLGSHHRILDSVPHATVLEEMRKHDVFVFPSLFEGFGMVITEALAQGLPVIITPATGPADMIEDGVQGWIVPIRDSVSITQRLQQYIDAPETIVKMGNAALLLAASWTWAHYRARLSQVVLTHN